MNIAKAREAVKTARLLAGIAACLTAPHVSAEVDLVNCLHNNGAPMEQRICDHLRRREAEAEAAARQHALNLVACPAAKGARLERRICDFMMKSDAEAAARQQVLEEQQRQAREVQQRVEAEQKAEQDRVRAEEDAARRARWEEEQAARTKAEEAERARQAAEDARAGKWVAQRKKECGSDYGKPTVGMTLDRAKRCVGEFEMYSQVNRVDGVVSMYRAGQMHISVMGGRIVHWASY